MSENRQFADAAGFLVGDAVWQADTAIRREHAEFKRLCERLRGIKRRRAAGAKPRPPRKPRPKPRSAERSCWQCGAHFVHAPTLPGPRPRFCCPAHRAAWHRELPAREAERSKAERLASRDRRVVDLTGQRFGLLTVVEDVTPSGARGARRWLARCDCGGTRVSRADHFKSGYAKSCGCMMGRKVPS